MYCKVLSDLQPFLVGPTFMWQPCFFVAQLSTERAERPDVEALNHDAVTAEIDRKLLIIVISG